MTLWTTFTPSKIVWELTTVQSGGKAASSNWMENKELIDTSLKLLKQHGISGIRLVIYPSELTDNGKTYDWKPIDAMLALTKKHNLQVDLCIGPYQYPNYPGIYLPKELLRYVFDNQRSLDTTNVLREYGRDFLEKQIEHFGSDKRIRGFHLANEWPDSQCVCGKEQLKGFISTDFMLKTAHYLKEHTDKPISLNTNIDAADKKKLRTTFEELLTILADQGSLGFDVYPSQESWGKTPLQKLRRLFEPYRKSLAWSQKHFKLSAITFCEVEAQPWGDGRSWLRIITSEEAPHERVLMYTTDSLHQTWNRHMKGTNAETISLWGADFWLSAHAMGIDWPLKAVKKLKAVSVLQ
jgi:hypothetical protein